MSAQSSGAGTNSASNRLLRCYCDHCPNNTCLVAPDTGSCYARITSNTTNQLYRTYNCLDSGRSANGSKLIIALACDSTSSEIMRCCNTHDFCNRNETFLPSDAEAKSMLERLPKPPPHPLPQPINPIVTEHPPIELKLIFVLLSGLLLIISIALAQNRFLRRRQRRRNNQSSSSPRQTSLQHHQRTNGSLLHAQYQPVHNPVSNSTSHQQQVISAGGQITSDPVNSYSMASSVAAGAGAATANSAAPNATTTTTCEPPNINGSKVDSLGKTKLNANGAHRGHNGDDCSENSLGRANSGVAVFDTNSVASREPLINNNSCNISQNPNHSNCFSMTSNQQYYSSMYQPYPFRGGGPFMTPDQSGFTGKPPSTFQMSIGSASIHKAETSSGSGAGQPCLTQRSIAHDIELREVVGRGYFGVVWRGEYKGEPVAVKIFSPMAEPSWERESEIYQTTMLRHKNILGFIAADKKHDAGITGYWLVTDYYPMGSLYDFLKDNSTSLPDTLRMAFSIANGLSHLHMEIFGTLGKPAIAHRDMKSKNILVKNDGSCCIADLGMAVRYHSTSNVVDVPTNTRVGTRRYLAPELLENRLNLMDFEAVKATDIYAFGLILWELLRRACLVHPSNSDDIDPNLSYEAPYPYEAPYQHYVSVDPSSEEMYEVVCVKKIRPEISERWTKFAPMRDYVTLMAECWYEKPQARLSSLRIRKSLGDIARHYYNLNMEYD